MEGVREWSVCGECEGVEGVREWSVCGGCEGVECIFMCQGGSDHSHSYAGTVIRTATVKLLECEKEFLCSRCKQTFSVQADFEQYYIIPRPTRCTRDTPLYCPLSGSI